MMSRIVLLILIMPVMLLANDDEFNLSEEIYENGQLSLISHRGNSRFASYLAMSIKFPPVEKLFKEVSRQNKWPLITRGEAHITVITPLEYSDVLKEKISMQEIETIAKRNRIQSLYFDIICLGRGQARLAGKLQETYFIVVSSSDLLRVRREVHDLFKARGGNAEAFDPTNYYPHITLGFSQRDLHETDGVIKDNTSCYADLII